MKNWKYILLLCLLELASSTKARKGHADRSIKIRRSGSNKLFYDFTKNYLDGSDTKPYYLRIETVPVAIGSPIYVTDPTEAIPDYDSREPMLFKPVHFYNGKQKVIYYIA